MDVLWSTLCGVSLVSFQARSSAKTGWNGPGQGTVAVQTLDPDTLIFEESGRWQPAGQASLGFSNTFRWTREIGYIRLEHLRFGVQNPVFLFSLVPASDARWVHDSAHMCGKDQYTAELHIEAGKLSLTWHVSGPFKDEEIAYVYH